MICMHWWIWALVLLTIAVSAGVNVYVITVLRWIRRQQ